jgi:hypothetical protein
MNPSALFKNQTEQCGKIYTPFVCTQTVHPLFDP